ncbi:MAG: hypothetical protein D3923_06130 [Candidatus Electrothrix sp. AR3]|nr:hypothetical protein [Candidatus Electrothrix sp. AR3]
MRSAKKVRLQSTISYLIGRLIFSCRFFSFIQKNLQTDYFGAESRSLLAEQLIAAGDAYVNVLIPFPFPTINNCLPAPLWKFRRRNGVFFRLYQKRILSRLGNSTTTFKREVMETSILFAHSVQRGNMPVTATFSALPESSNSTILHRADKK